MNSTSTIPVPTLITYGLWALVAAFTVVSWLGVLTGDAGQVRFGGFTAAVLVGPATVAHLSLYAARVCALIRAQAAPVPRDDLRVL